MKTPFASLLAITCISTCSLTQAQEVQDTIVVEGKRLEESQTVKLEEYGSRLEVIDAETLQRGGFDDASQALQSLVPGLYVAPKNGAFDYSNVSLLGSRSTEILWLVDGVRISNRLYNDISPLDTLPSHMIERIEVLKGGQGLFYGTQAVAGVINIVTKSFTKELDGATEVGFDTNDGQHANGYVRGGFGDHALVGYASYDDADGFQPFRTSDYQPSATNRERGYEVKSVGFKYAFEPSDAFRLSAGYQYTDAALEFSYAEDVANAFNAREEDIAFVKADWKLSEDIAFYLKGYWHNWDSHWTEIHNVIGANGQPTGGLDPVSEGDLWKFTDRGVNLLGEFALLDGVTGLLGYDFQKYDGRDDEFLIGAQTESVHAPFAQLRFDADILAGANVALGVRHNMPSDGEDKTVWNVSGKLNVTNEAFVRGQVGTSFRLPSAYELYVVDPCCEKGNPSLVGEESFNTELGVGYANDTFSAELIGFRRTVDDLIDIDFNLPAYPDGFIVNTDAQVEVKGGELVLGARLGERVKVTFDYTYSEAQADGSNDQLQDIPRELLKLGVDWTTSDGRYGAGMNLNHVGEIFDEVAVVGRVEHGDYEVLDLSGFAFLDVARRHRLGLRLENALDEEYASQMRRTRRDADASSYAAWALGTPRTGHMTYSYRF